jgi:hypothetical protein
VAGKFFILCKVKISEYLAFKQHNTHIFRNLFYNEYYMKKNYVLNESERKLSLAITKMKNLHEALHKSKQKNKVN